MNQESIITNSSRINNRIIFADILRISATFLVIVFHVAVDQWHTYSNTLNWHVANFFVSDFRWCVPVFFMLSGMLFLDPKRNVTIKKLYTKNIPHILIALFFWSLAYKFMAAIVRDITGVAPLSLLIIEKIIIDIPFMPSWMHLWFLYSLVGIYILVPVLRVYSKSASKLNYAYLFTLYIICVGILPIIESMINREFLLFKIDDLYGYTTYFIAGWFFYHYNLKPLHTKIIYTLGIISAVLIFSISTFMAHYFDISDVASIFDYKSVLNIFIAFSIFLYTKNYFKSRPTFSQELGTSKIISLLSSCSFGIYLTHMISFNLIYPLYQRFTGNYQIISLLIAPILIFLISFLLVYIIKQIPFLKKWII